MKKSILLISIGILNMLHAAMHLIQFLQSILLVTYSVHEEGHDSWISEFLHNPILTAIWALIGLFTLYIGIKDFIHHKKCKNETN